MTEMEAQELLDLYRVLFRPAGLPPRDDHGAVGRWRKEMAAAFKAFKLEDVADAARELARETEWAPHVADLLPVLEQQQGLKGTPDVETLDFVVEFPDGSAIVHHITKAPDGSLGIPRAIRHLATRQALVKQKIITTDDLVRMAKNGTLTVEEFVSKRDSDGKRLEKKLDYYTIEPERVYAALEVDAVPQPKRTVSEQLGFSLIPEDEDPFRGGGQA